MLESPESAKKPARKKLKAGFIAAAVAVGTLCGVALYSYAMSFSPPMTPPADHSKIVVAAIGDSNTYGSGVPDPDQNSYPAQLQALLGDSYQVINYGISGLTLLSTGDMPYTRQKVYSESQQAQPDIVFIMLGSNDSKAHNWNAQAYETELKDFVRTYQTLASAPMLYLMTPPAADQNPYKIDPGTVAEQIVPIVKRVADETQVIYIDIYALTKDHLDLLPDGVHPNAEGYKLIAQTVYDAIQNE